mmetsp:Transcript_6393/g.15820  ORF Transcript_6393/g.15820 Transcript_6393/m.15820 type:complete len:1478 (-) Transcript_6393:254-4687(-)
MVQSASILRARVEAGIPKLLVKINPQEAEAFGAKNLAEVTLRKVLALRGQVAVLHLSRTVSLGEVLMSAKLADLLDIEDEESVEVASGQPTEAPKPSPPSAAPAPGTLRSSGLAPEGTRDREKSVFDADWLRSLEREQASRRPPRERRTSEPYLHTPDRDWNPGASRTAAQASPPAMPPSGTPDWLRGLRSYADHYEQDVSRDFGGIPTGSAFNNFGLSGSSAAAGGGGGGGHLRYGSSVPNIHSSSWNGTRGSESRTRRGPENGPQSFRGDSSSGLAGSSSIGSIFSRRADQTDCQPPVYGGWLDQGAPYQAASDYGQPRETELPRGRIHSLGSRLGSLDGRADPTRHSRIEASPVGQGVGLSQPGSERQRRASDHGFFHDSPHTNLHTRSLGVDSLPASDGSGDEADVLRCLTGRHRDSSERAATDGNVPGRVRVAADRFGATAANTATHMSRACEAESLEPSPAPSRTLSRASSCESGMTMSQNSPRTCPKTAFAEMQFADGSLNGLTSDRASCKVNKAERVSGGAPSSGPASSSPSTAHTPRGVSSTDTSSPSDGERIFSRQEQLPVKRAPVAPARVAAGPTLALVPCRGSPAASGGGATPTPTTATNRSGGGSRALRRRKTTMLGALQPEESAQRPQEPRQPVPSHWQPPLDTLGGGLERSELGAEVTAEVRRWLLGETSGPQCSQVVLDRALTVLSNFKLSSGCQLEVLGGPLGAIVGGYSDADWLLEEFFSKQPSVTIREAFTHMGVRERGENSGDWSHVTVDEISLAYRRMCLRGHPSRGGSPRLYLKMQVAMELIRAFCGEAGPMAPVLSMPPDSFVLSDLTLVKELKVLPKQQEDEEADLSQEELEELNRAVDEYILRQMCFKSEIVDEIARLHEDSAYAILGISSSATDAEIKKAYRLIAMQCHPDKGGDKEEFQQLHEAYEKIMEQRRSSGTEDRGRASSQHQDDDEEEMQPGREKSPRKGAADGAEKESKAQDDKESPGDGAKKDDSSEATKDGHEQECNGENGGEDAEESDSLLIEKVGKAAEEASRYAKTAAEFAHQAGEAAEAARRDREHASCNSLTKSTAHSAIVYTLTVVKAVRAVGYATLDVAAQCRAAARKCPDAEECSERAVSAMSLGLEALNAALACAEVTEATAAELQRPDAPEDDAPVKGSAEEEESAAERFVAAAVRASLAAAGASNAAMSAAIAAVEGSRQCVKALEGSKHRSKSAGASPEDAGAAGEGGPDAGDSDDDDSRACLGGTDDAVPAEPPQRKRPPTPEEAAAAALKRSMSQRHNNRKVLQRLNAEILNHQCSVRQFLQANRQLIPQISGEAKGRIFGLLHDYAQEARLEIEGSIAAALLETSSGGDTDGVAAEALVSAVNELPLIVPFLQPQSLAIPVCVKSRVLKMAALYDLPLTMSVLENEVFGPARAALPQDSAAVGQDAQRRVDDISAKVRKELSSNVAEEGASASAPPRMPGFGGVGG